MAKYGEQRQSEKRFELETVAAPTGYRKVLLILKFVRNSETLDQSARTESLKTKSHVARKEEEMRQTLLLGMVMVALTIGALTTVIRSAQRGGATQSVTKADFERWKTELSNWGRWGKEDQIGALNLITPAKRRQAADLVREGFSVSLARDVDTEKAVDNPEPYEHTMVAIGSDRFGVQFHGVAHTHLDSLAHIHYDGVFYNGYAPDKEEVMKRGGHALARESNCHILKA